MAQMALVLALVLKLSESNFGGSSMQGFSKESLHSRYLSLSLEGVSQMVYILPERLLALVRPAFDLVLRRMRAGVWLQNRDP